ATQGETGHGRIVALEIKAVDGHAAGRDGENGRLIAVGKDLGLREAGPEAGDAGVRAEQGQRLVDRDIFLEQAFLNVNRVADVRRVEGAVDGAEGGVFTELRDIDVPRVDAHVADRGIVEVVGDSILDGVELGQRGGGIGAAQAVKEDAAGINGEGT